MGGTVDTSMPVVRQQGDSTFDDVIAKRLAATQEMTGVIAMETQVPEIRPVVNVETVQPLATAPKPPTSPQATTGLGTEIKLEQPATLKDVGLPEFELPDVLSQIAATSPQQPNAPLVSTELPIVSPEVQDVAAPHVPVIEPELDSRFENLLEGGLRIAEAESREGARLSAEGQRVEVGGTQTSGTGNITIEKIEIHADSEKSASDIARAVLEEFNRMRREQNF